MDHLHERIEQRLKQRTDQIRREANERLTDDFFDPLFDHLAEVIRVVAGIRDYSTEPYLDKVREVVCADCLADPSGRCRRRDQKTCGLNEYFPIIVAVIEQELKADL